MQDTAKYLIHADITADGVVERSDVVGAIFGQTEGLLGDELDLRDLQDSSKVGRIDVDVNSENGQSFGTITIATSLDKVETAILAAALETIDRVGPCRSTIAVDTIEDVRAAKRREVVERAKGLLAQSFDGSMLSSQELIQEVRESIRVEDVTEYEGYPAGPRVANSDAVIVVEGRSDVLQLLKYGIKNAIAVEGTNVPDAVAKLTNERTVTAFLDGDRGGDLILKELAQVGDVDYVAFAPPDRSVEDLDRHQVMAALRDKVPYEMVTEEGSNAVAATDGSSTPAPESTGEPETTESPVEPDAASADSTAEAGASESAADAEAVETGDQPTGDAESTAAAREDTPADDADGGTPGDGDTDRTATQTGDAESTAEPEQVDEPDVPKTVRGHVDEVVGGSGRVRLLTADQSIIAEGDADEAFDLLRDADPVPATVVVDGELSQRVLDVAAQRGVDQVISASEGDFVKRPTAVRIRTADQLQVAD